jgi:hypothetical protein
VQQIDSFRDAHFEVVQLLILNIWMNLLYLFSYGLFNDATSSSNGIAPNDVMVNEWTEGDMEGNARGLIRRTIPALDWRNWGNLRIVDALAEIRTGHLPNTSQKRYRLRQPTPCLNVVQFNVSMGIRHNMCARVWIQHKHNTATQFLLLIQDGYFATMSTAEVP